MEPLLLLPDCCELDPDWLAVKDEVPWPAAPWRVCSKMYKLFLSFIYTSKPQLLGRNRGSLHVTINTELYDLRKIICLRKSEVWFKKKTSYCH